MNHWTGIGRATRDAEVTTTNNGNQVARFTLAIERKFKDANGEKVTDFINIVAWKGLAEVCGKYIKKGTRVAVGGELQIRSYESANKEKRFIAEIIANDIDLLSNNQSNIDQEIVPQEKQNTVKTFEPTNDADLPW